MSNNITLSSESSISDLEDFLGNEDNFDISLNGKICPVDIGVKSAYVASHIRYNKEVLRVFGVESLRMKGHRHIVLLEVTLLDKVHSASLKDSDFMKFDEIANTGLFSHLPYMRDDCLSDTTKYCLQWTDYPYSNFSRFLESIKHGSLSKRVSELNNGFYIADCYRENGYIAYLVVVQLVDRTIVRIVRMEAWSQSNGEVSVIESPSSYSADIVIKRECSLYDKLFRKNELSVKHLSSGFGSKGPIIVNTDNIDYLNLITGKMLSVKSYKDINGIELC